MTLRRLRLLAIAGGLLLAVLVISLSILAKLQSEQPIASASVPAPLAVGTELQRPRPVPDVTLTDERGRAVSTSGWRGKWVILAPSMTLCHEVCPITSAALTELSGELRGAGLGEQVIVAEATVDPWRDTPARLRAYRQMTRADFSLLTGTQAEIRALWKFFGVFYKRVPQGRPADVDWMTHRPERFDVEHTDGVFLIDPHGQERIVDVGMPSVDGKLPAALRSLLNAEGHHNLAHPELPWTPAEVLDDLYFLMGRNIPASAAPAITAPSAAHARRALAGSPGALASLHDQAGQLFSSRVSLDQGLTGLRGYPIVLNVWASWCGACRAEFPVLASESVRYGRTVGFVGADINDSATNARSFLADHPVSYPSYQSALSQLARFGVIEGMPTTFFIDPAGKVVGTHVGPYQTIAALDNDIRRFAFGVSG